MTLWHGRFADGPAEGLLAFTVSIAYDRRLAPYDLRGSRAHVRGLKRAGILSPDDVATILAALDRVEEELGTDTFVFQPGDEDIHTAIERRVTEIAGVPERYVHRPWEMPAAIQASSSCRIGIDYPEPVVAPAFSRGSQARARPSPTRRS